MHLKTKNSIKVNFTFSLFSINEYNKNFIEAEIKEGNPFKRAEKNHNVFYCNKILTTTNANFLIIQFHFYIYYPQPLLLNA